MSYKTIVVVALDESHCKDYTIKECKLKAGHQPDNLKNSWEKLLYFWIINPLSLEHLAELTF